MPDTCCYASRELEIRDSGRLKGPHILKREIVGLLHNPRKLCLYVIEQRGIILYVGSSKSIGNTLSIGHYRKYPYRWLASRRGASVIGHFFSFDEEFGSAKDDEVREAIEGEVVFEVRSRTGRWPLDQVEIHFREVLRGHPGIKRCVDQVVDHLAVAELLRPM